MKMKAIQPYSSSILAVVIITGFLVIVSCERLDDMVAEENEPYTMTCPPGDTPFHWKKYPSNVTVARVFDGILAACEGPFKDRDCKVSEVDGSLTLGRINLSDEGFYLCEKAFEDHISVIKYLNVTVPPKRENMEMNTIRFPQPESVFHVWCSIDRIKPGDADVYFKFSTEPKIYNGTRQETPNPDNTFKINVTLPMVFSRQNNSNSFRCVVEPKNEAYGDRKTIDRKINMHWAYKTEVEESRQDEDPIEKQSKRLSCTYTEENKGKPISSTYVWLYEGKALPNNPKYEGASSRQLTIRDLADTDNGEYKCVIENEVGRGEALNLYELRVWTTYRSIVEKSDVRVTPLLGENLSLTCSEQKVGYPPVINNIAWYKDDGLIDGESNYEISGNDKLLIRNLKRTDNGMYGCRIHNAAGQGASTQQFDLEVYWKPLEAPVVLVDNTVMEVSSDLVLTCDTTGKDDGNPDASFSIWTKDGQRLEEVSGMVLTRRIDSVNDGGDYGCSVENDYGESPASAPLRIEIEAPVVIEEPKAEVEFTVLYNNASFGLACTASGSNIDSVLWFKDDKRLDPDYFMSPKQETVSGDFSYDQSEAIKSVVTRKIDGHVFNCDNVNYYTGTYRCQGEGTAAQKPSSARSPLFLIHTVYPPLWKGGSEQLDSASRDEKDKVIKCEVCVDPPDVQYQWKFENTQLRRGIEADGDEIIIDDVRNTDFGLYQCIVKSRHGLHTFNITLVERGKPHEPRNFEVVEETSMSVTLQWEAGFNAGYPQEFLLEYRKETESEYKRYGRAIPEKKGLISTTILPLAPSTEFVIRIKAINERPAPGINYSDNVFTTARTKRQPEVKLTSVKVEETHMLVSWKYGPELSVRRKRNSQNDDSYIVGVKIMYKKQSDSEYSTYPDDDRKIHASEEQVVINGTFNKYEPYVALLMVYENNLELETSSTKPHASIPSPKPAEGSSFGAIIGGVVAVVIILVVVVLIFIFVKRRRGGTMGKDGSFDHADQKANQRSSSGYSPLPNSQSPKDEDPYKNTFRCKQVNGEQTSLNLNEDGPRPYGDHDSGLYDVVERRPEWNSSGAKCPAGPPTVPPEEPMYAKPAKADKKNKKTKKQNHPTEPKENPYANTTNGITVENPYQNVDYATHEGESQENLYDDVALQREGSQEDLSPDNNVEGLIYADLDLKKDTNKAKKKKKPVVIQNEPPTDYAVIDFTKKAPAAVDNNEDEC